MSGEGVGLKEMQYYLPDNGVDMGWEFLAKDMAGESDHRFSKASRPAWNLNPDYQRGPCWTPEQQERFVGHVAQGGKVPLIYCQRFDSARNAPATHKKGDAWLDLPIEVIDGQQRLRAVRAFVKGEIGAQLYHQGRWVRFMWADLSKAEKRDLAFSSRIVFLDISREERLRFYLRLNAGGVAHSEEELDRVRKLLIKEEGGK